MPITAHTLNGQNYTWWAQSMKVFISGQGKDDYITGEAAAPAKIDPKYKIWKTENMMVMSWLLNSMTPEISEYFMFYETAKDIWVNAKKTYSNSENKANFFELEAYVHNLCQGNMMVTSTSTSCLNTGSN